MSGFEPLFPFRESAFYYFCAMAKRHTAYLLLGGNIHPRKAYLKKAIELISKEIGAVRKVSSVYESEPWGFEATVPFLNRVVVVETSFGPLALLKKTQEIERRSGRLEKSENGKYASRTLDIDILFFDDEVLHLPELTLPHPRMAERRFVLVPLAEVAPEKNHPVLGKSCLQLLTACEDVGKVWKLKGKAFYAV